MAEQKKSPEENTARDNHLDNVETITVGELAKMEEVPQEVVGLILSRMHIGPLPPASEFKNYDTVLPGAADRIMTMAEREQNNRIFLQQKDLNTGSKVAVIGQLYGFLIMAGFIGLSVWFAYTGQTALAAGAILVGGLSIVARFITNPWSKSED